MIKSNIYKTTTILVTILFFLLTGTDMYFEAYGDISQHPATEQAITEIKKLSDYYKKENHQIRLMTYNILADSLGFEGSPAQNRADGVCRLLQSITPDVCGLQETSRKWFACIGNNTVYKFVTPVRSALFDAMTTLIYNPDTISLVSFGEQVFKNGNSSRLRRMVWGVFRHKKTQKLFAVVNTHFSLSNENNEHNATPSAQAMELISVCNELKALFKCPVFPLGDFNTKPGTNKAPSPVYDILKTTFNNTKDLANSLSHGENTSKKTLVLDHIFAFGDVNIIHHATLSQDIFRELSNHYPIFCDIFIQ